MLLPGEVRLYLLRDLILLQVEMLGDLDVVLTAGLGVADPFGQDLANRLNLLSHLFCEK